MVVMRSFHPCQDPPFPDAPTGSMQTAREIDNVYIRLRRFMVAARQSFRLRRGFVKKTQL